MENSTKFHNFMELVPDAAVILDVASDKVVYVNGNCKRLLNISVGDTGDSCYEQLVQELPAQEMRART